MFERFTERARQVVVLAQDEARALGHNYVGTEHLLLGLLREEKGLAARVLEFLHVPIEEARARVAQIVPPTGEAVTASTGYMRLSPRAKKVLELALGEEQSFGHGYIGTEHILLGLAAEGEGVGARVLRDFGGDAETVRTAVISWLNGGSRPERADGPPEVEIRLRRVIPVAEQFSDGTWIVSVEVWDHGVTLRWAKSERPVSMSRRGGLHVGCHISDDAGTNYIRVGDSASGGPQRGFHGDVKFEPAPPPEATSLRIRREDVDELSILLTD